MERSTVDRVPTLLNWDNSELAASETKYFPLGVNNRGNDRMGNTFLVRFLRGWLWSNKAATLTLEISDDRVTWTQIGPSITVSASTMANFPWTILTQRYWRWKYVNSAAATTGFRFFEDKTPDIPGDPDWLTVTISSGQSQSAEIDLGPYKLSGIVMPAALTGTALSFLVSNISGGTYVPLYDDTNTEVTFTIAASRGYGVDQFAGVLAPWRFVKLRSGTSGTPTTEGADRSILLVRKK